MKGNRCYLILSLSLLCADQMLHQVVDMVNGGELSDASSPLLSPALLAQLSSSHSPGTDRTLTSVSATVAHPLRQESANDCSSPVTLSGTVKGGRKRERGFKKSKKRVYTAAVDEGMAFSCMYNED